MKFTAVNVAALTLLASMVAAQGNSSVGSTACTTCLQNSILALPLCKNLNITVGEFNPAASSAYAACLCSSLSGTWIDACQDPSLCGPDIESFKASYPTTMQEAGLICNGTTPTFIPEPTNSVNPTSVLPLGPGAATPTSGNGSSGKPSFGVKDAVPSVLFTQAMGVVAVVAAIGASFI